jgi:hypothetical protein
MRRDARADAVQAQLRVVSVGTMLDAPPSAPGSLFEQIASGTGPACPTANCSAIMKIQRYLLSPSPYFVSIGLLWDDVDEDAPSNVIQTLLQQVTLSIDLQRVFHGVKNPTSATLKALLCMSDDHLASFAIDAHGNW